MKKRTDENQIEIVNELRKLGYSVIVTSNLGKGTPDIMVGCNGFNYFFEIKSHSKSKLTKEQEKFHYIWDGQIKTVYSIDDILEYINKKCKVKTIKRNNDILFP